jgi:hypothetical protein
MQAGVPVGQIMVQIGEMLLAETVPVGLENAAATMRNKMAAAQSYLDSGLEGYSKDTLPELLAGVTADAASVEAAKAVIQDAVNVKDGATFMLTEALAIIAEGGELPEGYELADASHDFGALAFADAAAELEAAAAVVAGAANAEDLTFDPTYSLSDESLTAADVADVAVADLAAAQEAAVEELRTSELVAGATNGAEIVINNGAYTLADTLENLAAADAAVLEGAASYSLTDEAGDLGSLTKEQVALVEGATNAADFTYFTLTKGLEDLQAAQTELAAKLAEIATADNANEFDNEAVLKDAALETFVDGYTSANAATEAALAAQEVEDAQAAIDSANALLLTDRAKTVSSLGSSGDGATVVTALEGFTTSTVATDANIAKAVTDAQALVTAEKDLYLNDSSATKVADEDGTAQPGYVKLYTDGTDVYTTSTPASTDTFVGYGKVLPAINTGSPYTASTGSITLSGSDVTGFTGEITFTDNSDPAVVKVVTFVDGALAADEKDAIVSGTDFTISGFGTTASVTPVASYTDASILEVYTAAQLQTLLAEAEADLATDIANAGDNVALLGSLKDALVAFIAGGGATDTVIGDYDGQIGGTTTTSSGTAANTIDAITKILAQLDEADVVTEADEFVQSLGGTLYTAPATDASAAETALEAALKAITDRAALEDAVTAAKATFEATDSGAVLVAAEALQEDRDALIEAVAIAEAEKVEAEEYQATIDALVAEHDAIVTEIEGIEQQIADAGVENLVDLSTVTTSTGGTLFGADLFVYTSGTGDITITRFEADDQLFLGNLARVDLAAGDNLATARLGDPSVLEFFVKETNAGVSLYIETQPFAGNGLSATADITKIDITGLNVDQLVYTDGFLTIA